MKKDHSKSNTDPISFRDVSIRKPCSENWQAMDPKTGGRFCQNCQKEVIDFTDKSDQDLRRIVAQNGGSMCGRFRKGQIGEPLATPEKRNGLSGFIKKAAATAATLAIMQTAAQAVDTPASPRIEFSDSSPIKADQLSHPDPSPNTIVTGIVITEGFDNIPDDILIQLVYQSAEGRKTMEQTSHAGLFHFDLAGKSIPGTPVVVVIPAQTIKDGHNEHVYHATRFATNLVEGQNLSVKVKVDGLWDTFIMGDIMLPEDID